MENYHNPFCEEIFRILKSKFSGRTKWTFGISNARQNKKFKSFFVHFETWATFLKQVQFKMLNNRDRLGKFKALQFNVVWNQGHFWAEVYTEVTTFENSNVKTEFSNVKSQRFVPAFYVGKIRQPCRYWRWAQSLTAPREARHGDSVCTEARTSAPLSPSSGSVHFAIFLDNRSLFFFYIACVHCWQSLLQPEICQIKKACSVCAQHCLSAQNRQVWTVMSCFLETIFHLVTTEMDWQILLSLLFWEQNQLLPHIIGSTFHRTSLRKVTKQTFLVCVSSCWTLTPESM